MSRKTATILPSVIETDIDRRIVDYGSFGSSKAEKFSKESEIKLGWFDDFTDLYFEKLSKVFLRYIKIVPVGSSGIFLKSDLDDRIILFDEFVHQMFFNLWFLILYNPNIRPSSKTQVTEIDYQLMSDLIDGQLNALSAFRMLTMIYQDYFSDYEDNETIKRNLILLAKMDKKKKAINPESKSLLNSYIFELVLNKYKSTNTASNLEQFLVEFSDVLPEYKEKLEQEKKEIKEKRIFNKKGELLRIVKPKDSKIFNRDGESWKNLSKGLDQYKNSYRRKQLKKKK
jgi:hypothetical protein